MTTIAADHRSGLMVSESRLSDDTTWIPCTKIHRIGGVLVGCAGLALDVGKYLQWFRGGRKGKFPKLDNFAAIILREDGVYDVTANGHEQIVERGFHATGTGSHAALATMLLGFDARKAVEIACQIDTQSGGEIRVFELIEKAQ